MEEEYSCDRHLVVFQHKDWLLEVFRKETVDRYQVTAFYFQLFATKIISFEKIGTRGVSVGVTEDGRKGKND